MMPSEEIKFLYQMAKAYEAIQCISHIEYEYNVRSLVFEHKKLKLYHYQATVNQINSTPTLVVFATVNRPEILDLFPEQSFVAGLLAKGVDVYFLDWGYPASEDQEDSISDYVTRYLHECVKFIIKKTQKKQINLLGICQGGLLCLCYSSLFTHIKNLILISTPVNFHAPKHLVAHLAKKIDLQLLDNKNNFPGAILNQLFISLRPFELLGKKYLDFIHHIEDENKVRKFLRVEKWLHDAPDQARVAFLELIQYFYRDNKLIKGEIYLNKNKIDLANLTLPILNIIAKEDEIVPPSASRALKKYIKSSDYSEKLFPSGHIGIYVSNKVGNRMSSAIGDWLKKRDVISHVHPSRRRKKRASECERGSSLSYLEG